MVFPSSLHYDLLKWSIYLLSRLLSDPTVRTQALRTGIASALLAALSQRSKQGQTWYQCSVSKGRAMKERTCLAFSYDNWPEDGCGEIQEVKPFQSRKNHSILAKHSHLFIMYFSHPKNSTKPLTWDISFNSHIDPMDIGELSVPNVQMRKLRSSSVKPA